MDTHGVVLILAQRPRPGLTRNAMHAITAGVMRLGSFSSWTLVVVLLVLAAGLVAFGSGTSGSAHAQAGPPAPDDDPVTRLIATARLRDEKANQLRDAFAAERAAAQRLLEGELRLRVVEEQRSQAQQLVRTLQERVQALRQEQDDLESASSGIDRALAAWLETDLRATRSGRLAVAVLLRYRIEVVTRRQELVTALDHATAHLEFAERTLQDTERDLPVLRQRNDAAARAVGVARARALTMWDQVRKLQEEGDTLYKSVETLRTGIVRATPEPVRTVPVPVPSPTPTFWPTPIPQPGTAAPLRAEPTPVPPAVATPSSPGSGQGEAHAAAPSTALDSTAARLAVQPAELDAALAAWTRTTIAGYAVPTGALSQAIRPALAAGQAPVGPADLSGMLSLPLRGEVTTEFGEPSPFQSFHTGLDIGAPLYTPVVAAADGEVTYAGLAVPDNREASYGMVVVIRHGTYVSTLYAHLDDRVLATPVKAGDKVRRGQIIGFVGLTGLTTGPHLHFEVRMNGQPIDPRPLLRERLP
jgi:murein DD-endopeptidase MepM/ murein hydrolase activator NlpD